MFMLFRLSVEYICARFDRSYNLIFRSGIFHVYYANVFRNCACEGFNPCSCARCNILLVSNLDILIIFYKKLHESRYFCDIELAFTEY